MSDYKPITINIRLWWGLCISDKMDTHLRKGFDNLCDAIDAIHAQLEDENERLKAERDAAYNKGYDEGFANADDWFAERGDEMAEHGWIELPKDADGVPIRVGDVMVYTYDNTCPLPVVALVPPAVFLTDDGPRYADMCRHAPDTWERIIEDAVDLDESELDSDSYKQAFDALVARCKALAGDAE